MTDLPDLSHLEPIIEQRDGTFEELRAELAYFIEDAITSHPRSQQTELGPSEIGIPCARRLGHKLLGTAPVNDRGPAWKPTVGTAVHDWLERVFLGVNRKLEQTRFLLEHKVDVGEIAGETVVGKCDVYDRVTRTVWDWKIVGLASLRDKKANGPGEQYRVQAHAYGRGWVRRGLPVDRVAIYFLPQNGELSEAHAWSEPYDLKIPIKALERASGIASLTTALGTGALPVLPTADAYCRYCPYFLPAVTELDKACPGHAEAETQPDQDRSTTA